jgi:hypothetical protein
MRYRKWKAERPYTMPLDGRRRARVPLEVSRHRDGLDVFQALKAGLDNEGNFFERIATNGGAAPRVLSGSEPIAAPF